MFYHLQPGDSCVELKEFKGYTWALIHKKYDLFLCENSLEAFVGKEIHITNVNRDRDALKKAIIKKTKLKNVLPQDFYLVAGFPNKSK